MEQRRSGYKIPDTDCDLQGIVVRLGRPGIKIRTIFKCLITLFFLQRHEFSGVLMEGRGIPPPPKKKQNFEAKVLNFAIFIFKFWS